MAPSGVNSMDQSSRALHNSGLHQTRPIGPFGPSKNHPPLNIVKAHHFFCSCCKRDPDHDQARLVFVPIQYPPTSALLITSPDMTGLDILKPAEDASNVVASPASPATPLADGLFCVL